MIRDKMVPTLNYKVGAVQLFSKEYGKRQDDANIKSYGWDGIIIL